MIYLCTQVGEMENYGNIGDNLYERDFQDSELQYQSREIPPMPKVHELRPFNVMRKIESTMEDEGKPILVSYQLQFAWN